MSRISNWFASFLNRDTVKLILKLGEQILKEFLGKIAGELQTIAKEEVDKAQLSGLSGSEKLKRAFAGVKSRFPDLEERFINHAIETAVLALKASR